MFVIKTFSYFFNRTTKLYYLSQFISFTNQWELRKKNKFVDSMSIILVKKHCSRCSVNTFLFNKYLLKKKKKKSPEGGWWRKSQHSLPRRHTTDFHVFVGFVFSKRNNSIPNYDRRRTSNSTNNLIIINIFHWPISSWIGHDFSAARAWRSVSSCLRPYCITSVPLEFWLRCPTRRNSSSAPLSSSNPPEDRNLDRQITNVTAFGLSKFSHSQVTM